MINISPGYTAAHSNALDLPIAVAILIASQQLSASILESTEFIGELSLFGDTRPVQGIFSCARACQLSDQRLYLPAQNMPDIQLLVSGHFVPLNHLAAISAEPDTADLHRQASMLGSGRVDQRSPMPETFPAIIGQHQAKRALEIAAAGNHHLIMVGPPGAGKTMLARALTDLLPDLEAEHAMEVAAVYSASAIKRSDTMRPPFRDPHHSVTGPALVGGGTYPQPGEVALAHRGVLFMDELPHFNPATLNLLREPMESGEAVIARANYRVAFPSRFQLVAAMNPCPAGRVCREGKCRCSLQQVQRYQGRVPGPLIDRIDLYVSVHQPGEAALLGLEPVPDRPQFATSLDPIRQRIHAARGRQLHRQGLFNSELRADSLPDIIAASGVSSALIKEAVARLELSVRGYHKIWRVSRTIADLADQEHPGEAAFLEALSYRSLDWEAALQG